MKILSGSTHLRFNSRLNHACYANLHGCFYSFDTTPRPLASVYDHKLLSILNLPIDNDWWFWIDDDAFFTQFSRALDDIELDLDGAALVFPKSPINPRGGWTFLSSGNFFFKNCLEVHEFFAGALESQMSEIKGWWDESKLGIFTNGDQDKIVWKLFHDPCIFEMTRVVPYELFNTRPYHFEASPEEHFLVHFAVPGKTKEESLREFQTRFKFKNDSLIPDTLSPAADSLKLFSIDANGRRKHWWERVR